MGLGPIAGIHGLSLPIARKTEQAPPHFEVDASERSGDDPSSRQQQSAKERNKQAGGQNADAGDVFEATGGSESNDAEPVSQISEEGHDWFV